MRLLPLAVFCFLAFTFSSFTREPKREFRAAWIATVSNIDWPSKSGLPAVQQQQEFINRLEQLKAIGCNTVIVQIRPASDALYDSPYEPWSRYLTGRQGEAPFPYYDPLEFMIKETHKRNMDFHAWFNPFRGLVDHTKNPNPASHITRTHPDWVVKYGTKAYINPGIPQAREYVTNVILDVVKRYDIDAVHLDDYFYPYRIAGAEFGDQAAFKKYGQNFPDIGDWRRNNVDLFVANLNINIKNIKPFVKLGISPFGVWRNSSKDPIGSATRAGQTNYDDLYADVLQWMRKGWIDYLLPQLYWEHNHKAAAFDVLLPWWEKHTYERHIYYGLGVYRMLAPAKFPWNGPDELLWQIKDIRKTAAKDNSGFAWYSTSNFDKISSALTDSLKASYTAHFAFPPVMRWLDSIAPPAPELKLVASNARQVILQWEQAEKEEGMRYAVYKFENDEEINLSRIENIVQVTQAATYKDTDIQSRKAIYVVTALDRLWNESQPSNEVEVNNAIMK